LTDFAPRARCQSSLFMKSNKSKLQFKNRVYQTFNQDYWKRAKSTW
jgi:hypothetical protein